ncbi:MAG: hypothetical protein G01um1014106_493 [Parcubacteria group bacterium Gr01-1014_106]|nr:MAG: hypothetical protein G01um1014106_493 [Parcubacteria group bacterium Gr01-1014_106]
MHTDDVILENAELLRRFPKRRPSLPDSYAHVYTALRDSDRPVRFFVPLQLERWLHTQAAREKHSFPLLELGAGALNHVPYEEAHGDYDIVEPFTALYRERRERSRVRRIFSDISDIPIEAQYQRIISIAVLEHVLDLPTMIARCALLVRDRGVFCAGIPSEGEFLWHLASRFGTGIVFRWRFGVSYTPFIRREHINTADEIVRAVKIFFADVHLRRFPFSLHHLSLYTMITARKPQREIATAYLHRVP